ncbi:hypothetical protein ACQ4WX_51195 [Streptomyces lasalocidi]
MADTVDTTRQAAGFRELLANGPVRLLVICSLINSVGFFAMMPFLALYLADLTTLPPRRSARSPDPSPWWERSAPLSAAR